MDRVTVTKPNMPTRRRAPGRPDYALLLAVVGLVVFGLMMIFSATFTWPDSAKYVLKQTVFAVIGLGTLAVLSLTDQRLLRRWAIPVMGVCVLSLVGVLVLGGGEGGASSWVAGASIQPTEFVKLGFIIYMAAWLAPQGGRIRDVSYGLFPFIVLLGVVCGLIVLQPDFGAAALIAGTSLAMFFIAGADVKQLVLSVAGGSGVLVLLVSAWPYAQDRLRTFVNPASDPLRTGWHIQRILTALRSGGLFGRGLGNGEFKLLLPLPHTDAIFPVIGEELGLVGCVVVIGVYAFIIWRGMRISLNAPDIFSSLLASGVSCWVALQALVHIAGNTATLPYTGVTLPFVSYGGSSLIMTLAGIGVLLRVSRVIVEKPIEASSTFAFGRRYRRARLSRTGRR